MTKTIMILVITAAFVAGSIATGTFASAAPPENNPGQPFDAILQKLDEVLVAIGVIDTSGVGLNPATQTQIDNIESEVTNIEGKLDGTVPSLVTDIKTEADKIQMIKDDVGMIKTTVGGIDTEVTNIEGKLDNPTTGLAAIKTGIDNISTGGGSSYVPYVEKIFPNEACGSGEFRFIRINTDTTGNTFNVNSILLRVTVDESGDRLTINEHRTGGTNHGWFTDDVIIVTVGGINGVELMGAAISNGEGHFPFQLTGKGVGGQDIEVILRCFDGPNTEPEIESIIVSGWKKDSDTISVQLFDPGF